MEIFLQDTFSYLLLYKYAALFFITFFAAFALPLPSTTSLMTAAGFASQGYMNIGLVIFWVVLGNVLADNLAYFVARHYGSTVFKKIGFDISESRVFHFIEKRLYNHSRLVIFWSRFEVIMTITVNILSGIAKTQYRRFFIASLLGETAQVLLFAGLGYFFGNSLTGVVTIFGEIMALVIVVILASLFLLRKRLMWYLLRT